MLPNSFNNYFIKLENMNNYNTRQKSRIEHFQTSFSTETRKKNVVLSRFERVDPQKYRQLFNSLFLQTLRNLEK